MLSDIIEYLYYRYFISSWKHMCFKTENNSNVCDSSVHGGFFSPN
jgi:hypothetical protein